MNWQELLRSEIDIAYRAADGLMAMVTDDKLGWRPTDGENWMTTGQLLRHLSVACGAAFRSFLTGDWGLPEGESLDELPLEEMLPPAEKMPSIASVAEARRLLAEDKQLALDILEQASGELERPAPAPWDPAAMPLGRRLLDMVGHLNNHKSQLFYYLKLQGLPVNTTHLYGMA